MHTQQVKEDMMHTQQAKETDRRLATIEGHIRAVRKMVEEGKDCIAVITQLLAIESSVKKAGMAVLKNHMNTCIRCAVEEGNFERVQELQKILEIYI